MNTPSDSQPGEPDPRGKGRESDHPVAAGAGAWLDGLQLDGRDRQRAVDHVRALRWLEPLAAPTALDGAVVASLHGGHREERAAEQLMSLAPLRAPARLDALVAAAVLEESARDPEVRAPAALDDLVARSISGSGAAAADEPAKPAARGLVFHRPGGVLAGGLAVLAAAGVLLVGLSTADPGGRGDAAGSGVADGAAVDDSALDGSAVDEGDAPRLRLVVERIDPDQLSSEERAFLRRTGGFLLGGQS